MSIQQTLIMANLTKLNLLNTPVEEIICRPGHELWVNAGNPLLQIEDLCRNVHWCGRQGSKPWVWEANGNGNNTGEPLARGQITSTNCGGFNATARWIGHNVLGLSSNIFKSSFTQAGEYFISISGLHVIDINWPGNVCTLTQDCNHLHAFFFSSHSWSSYGTKMFDVSTNTMNFHTKTDVFWCSLGLCNLITQVSDGRAFMVTHRYQNTVIPGTGPFACISTKSLKKFRHLLPIIATGGLGVTQSFVNRLPDITGSNWETFLLVSREHLTRDFRKAVNLP